MTDKQDEQKKYTQIRARKEVHERVKRLSREDETHSDTIGRALDALEGQSFKTMVEVSPTTRATTASPAYALYGLDMTAEDIEQ